ncbi:hypothetical protein pipiens_007568 [Culex pipiens pipiens]|uniref:Uncharacterized protein n=1 Tax=Culex pipiens pipiens TaxID=38569 RepID=A0ABD1DKV8_CULPP
MQSSSTNDEISQFNAARTAAVVFVQFKTTKKTFPLYLLLLMPGPCRVGLWAGPEALQLLAWLAAASDCDRLNA